MRILKGKIKDLFENDIRMLCEWRGSEIMELNRQEDRILKCFRKPLLGANQSTFLEGVILLLYHSYKRGWEKYYLS